MLGHRYPSRKPAGFRWRLLLAGECLRQPARIYEILPLRCALCGSEMRVIAFVIDVPAVSTILAHLGEPTAAPEAAPALARRCGGRPPGPTGMTPRHPRLQYVFDQRVSSSAGPYLHV
jgi:hypothetical protein